MTGGKRTLKNEKLARIYDQEILPIWSMRFGRMLLRGLELPPKAMVLDVGCGTGYPALELLRRLDDQGRVIAVDSSPAMLDVARRKLAGFDQKVYGKKIFFRSESALPKLSFTDDVYDVVMCNLGLGEFEDPQTALTDFMRVTKPGGRVLCTLPLAGTFGEFHDIFREVLVKHDRNDAIERLDRHLAEYPDADDAERWLERAGLVDATVEVEEFTLLFRSAREFFFAPIIEYGPLAEWKAIAGSGQELQDVFWHIKQAIETYFADRAFEVTVKAGALRGRKPLAAERTAADLILADPATSKLSAAAVHSRRLAESGLSIPLATSEVELIDAEAEFAANVPTALEDLIIGEADEDVDARAAAELDAFRPEPATTPRTATDDD